MERDIHEVISSQMKMLGKKSDVFPVSLINTFKNDVSRIKVWADKEPFVNILFVNYKDLIENPLNEFEKICDFLCISKDMITNMLPVIDKSLYRSKV
jgi:hypothetical protein